MFGLKGWHGADEEGWTRVRMIITRTFTIHVVRIVIKNYTWVTRACAVRDLRDGLNTLRIVCGGVDDRNLSVSPTAARQGRLGIPFRNRVRFVFCIHLDVVAFTHRIGRVLVLTYGCQATDYVHVWRTQSITFREKIIYFFSILRYLPCVHVLCMRRIFVRSTIPITITNDGRRLASNVYLFVRRHRLARRDALRNCYGGTVRSNRSRWNIYSKPQESRGFFSARA